VKFRIGGKLTDAQVAAGFLVGTICGAFERFHGKRRSVASPNYERACGKGRDDEPPHTDRRRSSRPRTAPAQIRDHAIEDERHARERWADLQDEFEKLPAAVQARAHRLVEVRREPLRRPVAPQGFGINQRHRFKAGARGALAR
jgi:hypothetical protein